MSTNKLFITGGTGYIGGSVLDGISKQFPNIRITALLRAPRAEFKARYPNVEIVQGDFDAFGVIEKSAEDADIVIHAGDHNHRGCAAAILSGLRKKTTPSFLIHLTGTGCISDEREQTWEGNYNSHVWNDVAEIQQIYDLPDTAKHHVMDKEIMNASNELIHTACVCPPDIYGQSTAVGNRATFLIPEFVRVAIEKKEAFYLGRGENIRAVTHIDDVVDLFVILVGQALQGGGAAQWGKEGFYFVVSGEVKWIDAAEAVNKIGVRQGWLPADSKAVSWTEAQVDESFNVPHLPKLALYLWGSNSRADSARARKLGWKPHGPSFWDSLEEDVSVAVKRLRH
ncbi:NAD(P)-binding protein [Hyaloscypha variabilis]